MKNRIAYAIAGWLLMSGLCMAAPVTIREIQVQTLDAFAIDAGDVTARLSVKVGDAVDQVRLNRDIKTLNDTQLYSMVNVETVPLIDGYRIVFVVLRRHHFAGPAEIKGMDYFSRSRIEDWLDLKDGAPVDDQVLAVKCNKIRDEYMKRYFPKTEVTATMTPVSEKGIAAKVQITIVEGPRVKPDEYVFHGNQALSDKDLRKTFGEYPWWNPIGWFSTPPYNEQQLEDARQNALDAYLDAGYLDAKVLPARFDPLPNNPKRAKVVFDVQEGPRYRVGVVKLTGVKLFPETEVAKAITLKTGEYASRKTIQDTTKNIRDFYGSRGYIDASAPWYAEPMAVGGSNVTVHIDVREGLQVTIRSVIIRGNERTKDKVIRREIPVSPGQVFNEVSIEHSENRLKNLGFFDEVRHSTLPDDLTTTNRDLIFQVKEGQTGSVMLGGGYSSVDKIVGYLQLQQRNFDILNWPNFTGGGQKARLDLEIGSLERSADVSWTEPWFLDKPIALTVDLYLHQVQYEEYRDTRVGASVGVSYPVYIGAVGLKYTLEHIAINDTLTNQYYKEQSPLELYRFDQEKKTVVSSSMQAYWDYDTRNKAFVPTQGTQAGIFARLSGSVFGGDNDVFDAGANYRHWFLMPWWQNVLSVRGRVESVSAYGNMSDVPVYDRLFLGGGRTIRGIYLRDVGPKVINTTDPTDIHPVGGDTLAMVSGEYTIPIFEAVRLAVFSDAGSVTDSSYDFGDIMKKEDFCWTYGMGIRIDIPGFPIRIDYANPIVKSDTTRTERFVFWIGFE